MKKGIHPNWTHQAQVTCSCGNKFTVGSTLDKLEVDICNKCHPFFTGEMKFVDRQGRVDKFMKKMKAAEDAKSKSGSKKSSKKDPKDSKSYKDVLKQQQTVLKQVAKGRAQKEA
jgi:large subunit ribosomal protein L31